MIVLSLVVVGAAGFFRLGVDRFPSVDLPTVSVRVGLPGAAPEEVESLVTQQLEEVINTVDGISELRSVSGQGSGFVIATFRLDRNLESAAQDVRDRVNTLGRRLPEDATPPVVQKFDNDSTPVLTVALSAAHSANSQNSQTRQSAFSSNASVALAKCAWSVVSIAPSTSGSTRNVWRLTRFRSLKSEKRSNGKTLTCPAVTSPRAKKS
jgi:multidrug efflux pump subunit AcrB